MSAVWLWLVILALAGALGSIPFGVLVSRIVSGTDVRRVGSGNIGATNVLRASGPAAAALTLALDIAKGSAAVLAARAGQVAFSSQDVRTTGALDDWAGLAAVTGHIFSPWLSFRGGKGVATASGALAVLSPFLLACALVVFAVMIALTRIVSLASISACLAIPLLAVIPPVGAEGHTIVVTFGMSALILLRHSSNIGRLLRGEEPSLGSGRGREKRS